MTHTGRRGVLLMTYGSPVSLEREAIRALVLDLGGEPTDDPDAYE